MALSDSSIKNPVFAWMLFIGIVMFGLIAFTRLGVSSLPDVDYPVLSISTTWQNAAPEVVETEVTDLIEDAIMGIQGVQDVTSTSIQGASSITVQFDLNKNIDVALQEVQSNIARAQRNLPRDIDPPVITKSNPEDSPIMWISLSGNRPLNFLMAYTNDYLKNQFTTIPGVGEVLLGGYVDPNLRVWLNADKMSRNELTAQDVSSAILSEHTEVPAGFIDTGNNEVNVRMTGEAANVEEFSSLSIQGRQGMALWKTFKIGDVAKVEDGLAPVRRISRTMGELAVGLGIKKQRGTNAVEVANAVKKRIAQIQKFLPAGMQLRIRFDTTTFVKDSIHDMTLVMILSIILTSLVCWLFLGSFSSAVNVFLTIPMSICGTLFVIYILGFTLNTFTLLGLSLVIGIVVDDAIMMLENIARHREGGETKIRAAVLGSREITLAAIAASVAILAIFVPVIFMQGIIGKFFLQFGVTISVAVAISLLGALTLTPMFCSQFLQIGHSSGFGKAVDNFMVRLKENYASLLAKCLENRWKVVLGSFGIFIVSLMLFAPLKKEFVPPQDQGLLMARLYTRVGSSIEFTDSVALEAEKIIMKHPEVASYFSSIGGDVVNTAGIMLTLKPKGERPIDPKKRRPLTQQELMPLLRKELKAIPGMDKVSLQDPSLMGFSAKRGYPIEFTINGPDWDKLAELSEQMKDAMNKTGLMTDIDSNYQIGMPEVRVIPDRKKAAERGVSVAVIGDTINYLIGGVRVGKYTKGARRYDIRVQLVSQDMKQVQDINKIWVRNNRGQVVRLSEVISIVEKPSLLSISRDMRERAIRMYANVAPGKSQGEALNNIQKIGKQFLPDGYKVVLSGSAQTFVDSFKSLYLVLIIGIFVAYMVLGTQFNSFVHPVTVLIALPFSISGAVLALLLSGQSLNMYSAIGMILLMGIVKKNSILLVDFTNHRRTLGMGMKEALLNACPLRLRPILMTSVATIAAAVPPALALGPGAETRVPMAVVVIGGVALSTLLTLFVVPCFYSIISRFESKQHVKDVQVALAELSKI